MRVEDGAAVARCAPHRITTAVALCAAGAAAGRNGAHGVEVHDVQAKAHVVPMVDERCADHPAPHIVVGSWSFRGNTTSAAG